MAVAVVDVLALTLPLTLALLVAVTLALGVKEPVREYVPVCDVDIVTE